MNESPVNCVTCENIREMFHNSRLIVKVISRNEVSMQKDMNRWHMRSPKLANSMKLVELLSAHFLPLAVINERNPFVRFEAFFFCSFLDLDLFQLLNAYIIV
jgi:hypothetical protein